MIFSFHIQGNFYTQGNFRIMANFHILDFYIDYYTLLYQAFLILENFHILEIFLFVSYFCTLSKLQYASMINIGIRKQIYLQEYNIYAHALH